MKTFMQDKVRLETLITELTRSPDNYHDDIINSYRDLLLSNNILYLLKEQNQLGNCMHIFIFTSSIHSLIYLPYCLS